MYYSKRVTTLTYFITFQFYHCTELLYLTYYLSAYVLSRRLKLKMFLLLRRLLVFIQNINILAYCYGDFDQKIKNIDVLYGSM